MSHRFKISLGNSRFCARWNNITVSFDEFCNMCANTRRTAETMAEYMAMSKDEQSSRKDVGGFVGGHLREGRRGKGFVLARGCATLDLDSCDGVDAGSICGKLRELDCQAVVYSTHKHTPQSPRLRVVIPFSRDVSVMEYDPVCRRIAEGIGLGLFDPTTTQPERLFYWPSTPADGEFFFERIDGMPLDVDEVLATYTDWRDAASWPRFGAESAQGTSPRLFEAREAASARDKSGIVGEFCRAYPISEAIATFLPDIYRRESKNRYTYVYGSTSGGLCVYNDDTQAYSNHSTDPARGHSRNAFDLVRMHRFGDLDGGRNYDDNPAAAPSFKAMCELAAVDSRVKSLRYKELFDEFGDMAAPGETPPEENPETLPAEAAPSPAEAPPGAQTEAPSAPVPSRAKKRKSIKAELRQGPSLTLSEEAYEAQSQLPEEYYIRLKTDKNGHPTNCLSNICLILQHHPVLGSKIYYDLMASRICIDGPVPWPRTNDNSLFWNSADDAGLALWFDRCWGMTGADNMGIALRSAAMGNKRNPLLEYFEALRWDGVERLDTMICDFIGAQDCELNRFITRMHLANMVWTVYEPGHKYDYTLILQGAQGLGKSSLWSKLAIRPEYYLSGLSMGTKDKYENVLGKLIVDLGELKEIMDENQARELKDFLTATSFTFRAPYERRADTYNRTWTFVGTTNDMEIFSDPTGNRRFLVIPCDKTLRRHGEWWFEKFDAVRDQIWAEAVVRYREGTPVVLPPHLQKQMEERLKDYTNDIVGALSGELGYFVNILLPDDWNSRNLEQRRAFFKCGDDILQQGKVRRRYVCVAEYLCEYQRWNKTMPGYLDAAQKVGAALRQLGWKPIGTSRKNGIHGSQKTFERPGDSPSEMRRQMIEEDGL